MLLLLTLLLLPASRSHLHLQLLPGLSLGPSWVAPALSTGDGEGWMSWVRVLCDQTLAGGWRLREGISQKGVGLVLEMLSFGRVLCGVFFAEGLRAAGRHRSRCAREKQEKIDRERG